MDSDEQNAKVDKEQAATPPKPKFLPPIKPITPPAGLSNAKPAGPQRPNSFHSANRVKKKSGR